MNIKRVPMFALFVVALVLFATTPAYAYIDPGSGSMILQGLVAVLAVGLASFKLYWGKLKSFFGKKSVNESSRDNSEES